MVRSRKSYVLNYDQKPFFWRTESGPSSLYIRYGLRVSRSPCESTLPVYDARGGVSRPFWFFVFMVAYGVWWAGMGRISDLVSFISLLTSSVVDMMDLYSVVYLPHPHAL